MSRRAAPAEASAATRADSDVRVTPAQLKAAKIRELSGKHLTLYTDLPASSAVDKLIDAFDQAYPQWCTYFGVTEARTPPWRATVCLMGDKKRFVAAGLLPADLPAFDNAYFRGNRIWIYDQRDDYYRRHLLLHEGTHAFMNAVLGSCGPPWYMEGIAELLATHAILNGQVNSRRCRRCPRLGPRPASARCDRARAPAEVRRHPDLRRPSPRTGRAIRLVLGRATFLDGHPRFQERFRKLAARPDAKDFNERLRRDFTADWPQLAEEWQLFVDRLEYGYDQMREAIDFRPGKALQRPAQKSKSRLIGAGNPPASRSRPARRISYARPAGSRSRPIHSPGRAAPAASRSAIGSANHWACC